MFQRRGLKQCRSFANDAALRARSLRKYAALRSRQRIGKPSGVSALTKLRNSLELLFVDFLRSR